MIWIRIVFGIYVFSLLFLQFWIVHKETEKRQRKKKEQKIVYAISNELNTYIDDIEDIRYKGE